MAAGYRDLLASSGARAGNFTPTPNITGSITASFSFTGSLGGQIGFFSLPGFWITGAGFPNPEQLLSTIPLTTTVSAVFSANGPLVSNIDLSFSLQGRQPPGFATLFAPWVGGGLDGGMMQGAVSFAFSSAGTFAASEGFFQSVAVTSSFTVSATFETVVQKYQGRFRSPLMHPGYGPWNPGLYDRRHGSTAARALGEASGTVQMSCSVFGTLDTISGNLFGDVRPRFTVVGTLDEAGSLRSTVPMLFTPVGVLGGDGPLVGDVQVALGLTGTITDPGAVAGNVSTSFSCAGVLEGAGSMQGSVGMTLAIATSFAGVWTPINTGGHRTIWTPIRTR